jgi:predicted nucleic acid-binding protein
MSRYVLDASVAVKLYVPEVHSDLAARFFADNHELIAPDLLPSEFANILWKKSTQRGEITISEGQRIVTEFQSLPVDYYSSMDLVDEAFKIATSTQRTIYDSLYVALAAQFGCQIITDDRKLFNSLKGTSFAPLLSLLEDY